MIYFDFSKAGVSLERLEKCFETYCNVVLYLFIKDYASYYYDNFEEKCCIWLKGTTLHKVLIQFKGWEVVRSEKDTH